MVAKKRKNSAILTVPARVTRSKRAKKAPPSPDAAPIPIFRAAIVVKTKPGRPVVAGPPPSPKSFKEGLLQAVIDPIHVLDETTLFYILQKLERAQVVMSLVGVSRAWKLRIEAVLSNWNVVQRWFPSWYEQYKPSNAGLLQPGTHLAWYPAYYGEDEAVNVHATLSLTDDPPLIWATLKRLVTIDHRRKTGRPTIRLEIRDEKLEWDLKGDYFCWIDSGNQFHVAPLTDNRPSTLDVRPPSGAWFYELQYSNWTLEFFKLTHDGCIIAGLKGREEINPVPNDLLICLSPNPNRQWTHVFRRDHSGPRKHPNTLPTSIFVMHDQVYAFNPAWRRPCGTAWILATGQVVTLPERSMAFSDRDRATLLDTMGGLLPYHLFVTTTTPNSEDFLILHAALDRPVFCLSARTPHVARYVPPMPPVRDDYHSAWVAHESLYHPFSASPDGRTLVQCDSEWDDASTITYRIVPGRSHGAQHAIHHLLRCQRVLAHAPFPPTAFVHRRGYAPPHGVLVEPGDIRVESPPFVQGLTEHDPWAVDVPARFWAHRGEYPIGVGVEPDETPTYVAEAVVLGKRCEVQAPAVSAGVLAGAEGVVFIPEF